MTELFHLTPGIPTEWSGQAKETLDIPGRKYDTDKLRMDLLEPEFIELMGRVVTFGAAKYSAQNWRNLTVSRILAAMFRHAYRWAAGETEDQEMHASHLAAVAINAMFLWWITTHRSSQDDRSFK